jgi:hypothetical protein
VGVFITGLLFSHKFRIDTAQLYGPCSDKVLFWSKLAKSGILSLKNLILGGDLNLYFEAEESWGGAPGHDPSGARFKAIFENNSLLDIRPTVLSPTWRNGRMGLHSLARRLDRYFVAAELLASTGPISSWVESPFFSDHAPVILQLRLTEPPNPAPFKFNHSCLAMADYIELVKATWTDQLFNTDHNPQTRLVWKLKVLKSKDQALVQYETFS